MNIPADYIDWETVWFEKICKEKTKELERDLTDDEVNDIKNEIVGDPCDECCCARAWAWVRKDYPCLCHC